jgi:hypothetical protein
MLAEQCTAVLGRELTAYISAAGSIVDMESRLSRNVRTADLGVARSRLQATAEVIGVFTAANRVALTGAWLREVAAITGDPRPPASVLRECTDVTATRIVTRAAGSYVHTHSRLHR